MASVATRIPKPRMADIQKKNIYKHMLIGIAVGTATSTAFYYGCIKRWEEKERKFYETYDPYAEFERMRAVGLFETAPPDWVLEEQRKIAEQKKKK